ncbi:MAG: MBL fold metallo-hydrolase [Pseudomonadota bacterium]
MFEVTFWGVRGSIPCCGPQYNEYGGHTCCVGVRLDDAFIILDAGTGILPLGEWVTAQKISKASLLLSHVHFDHIIGLPFFAPLWNPDFSLDIFASHLIDEGGIEAFFRKNITHPLFPGSLIDMARADLTLHDVVAGDSIDNVPGLKIYTQALNHPGGATGYRLEAGEKSLCYITDTEHMIGHHDVKLLDFIQGTDCLIYDAMYTSTQHKEKIGWGHSTWQEAAYLAQNADVKQLVLYHHNHAHTDEMMREIEGQLKEVFAQGVVAKQGMKIELE